MLHAEVLPRSAAFYINTELTKVTTVERTTATPTPQATGNDGSLHHLPPPGTPSAIPGKASADGSPPNGNGSATTDGPPGGARPTYNAVFRDTPASSYRHVQGKGPHAFERTERPIMEVGDHVSMGYGPYSGDHGRIQGFRPNEVKVSFDSRGGFVDGRAAWVSRDQVTLVRKDPVNPEVRVGDEVRVTTRTIQGQKGEVMEVVSETLIKVRVYPAGNRAAFTAQVAPGDLKFVRRSGQRTTPESK